ncbi:MAG: sugar phosphate isomerase/epimerase family protein [Stellaceae bacterium]
MTYTFSVISDEIAPDIDTAIRFAREHGLSHLDLRSIDGRNLIDLEDGALAALARKLQAAGLAVACLASPLLKWLPPGRSHPPQRHDAFGFAAGAVDETRRFRRCFEICERLGTRRLRIFSYLAYDGFAPADLARPLSALLDLAERHDCVLLLENEPVCNIATAPALLDLVAGIAHRRLRALFDLGNLQAMGAPPSAAEIAALAPWIGYIHVKDYASGRGIVPLGEGAADHRRALAIIADAAALEDIPLALETHLPAQGWAASAVSLAALRALLAELPARARFKTPDGPSG